MSLEGRVLGEFTLREQIGEGGFAVVYRAEQPALEREAVVKVLHERLARRADVAARFLREARLASRLDHPYAAHVYAFGGESDHTLWIAMELVRGISMDRWIATKGPLALEQLVPLFERICEVVQTAHDRGIVHRDLKPANVMILERAGRLLPKLLDFGIARVLDEPRAPAAPAAPVTAVAVVGDATAEWNEPASSTPDATASGAALGSPAYMAPEQWVDASTAGPSSDLYALGVLAFEALTGRQPFTGATAAAIMAAHANEPPPPLPAELPRELGDAIARALAKAPRERPASAGELAASLRAASGLGERETLPQLPPALRDTLIATAPQPIAEAIAALETARNVDQACALLVDVVVVANRWIGIVALAARTRTGSGGDADGEQVRALVRELGRSGLDDDGWLELARLLVRPFAGQPDLYPVPELVGCEFAAYAQLRDLRGELDRRAGRSSDERRALFVEALAVLARLLEPLRAVFAYTVVVPRRGHRERWSGPRRQPRGLAPGAALPDGEVFLVDAAGAPVLRLSPIVQIAAPAPGKVDEMFVLDGRDAAGARMIAAPYGYTRHDPALADWLRDQLALADSPAPAAGDTSPYRGLAPFTAADAAFYVGREREVEAAVNRLRDEPLLAVVGPSGAGKSSFVQAGIVPALLGWRAIVVRPGAAPIAALEARLARDGIVVGDLADDPGALAVALADARTVLVIDQLEELFTLCRDDRMRQRYAAILAATVRSPDDPVRVVVTLRDDFLVRCDALEPLRAAIPRGLVLLGTPAPEELERIVGEPARRAGCELEDRALAAEMVDAVAGRPGALALLSFTATELWKLRDRHFHQLTRKAYTAIGGVAGALARHAEETLAALPAEDARLVREAFRHLVTAEGTRQVLSKAELRQLLAKLATPTAADRVIDRLIAARLVVVAEEVGGDDRVEVIHEALFDAWPRLVTWRREDAEGARLRDQLRAAARQWQVRARPRGLLWRDDALAEYRIWRARYAGTLTDVESEFAAASLADAARGRRLRRLALATAFVALAGGLAITLYLRRQASAARAVAEQQLQASHIERGRLALLASDTATARTAFDQARAAGATGPSLDFMTARARAPLAAEIATLAGHTGKVTTVAFDATGTRVLTAGEDGTAKIWDAATGLQLHELAGSRKGQLHAAWRGDGGVLTFDAGGELRSWNADGTLARRIAGQSGTPDALVYRAATQTAAAVTLEGDLAIWNTAAGTRTSVRFDARGGEDVIFDPQRDRVVTTGLGGFSTWKLDGTPELAVKGEPVWYAVLDPQAHRIVTTSYDGTARVWDASSGAAIDVLRAHENRTTHVAIDRRGKLVATASADTTVRLWRLDSGDLVATLRGHTKQVNWVGFTADHQLVSTASDGTARLWDPERALETAVFAHGSFIMHANIDPTGRRLATASWTDGTVKIWNLERRPRIAVLADPDARYQHLKVGGALVAGSTLVRYGPAGIAAWDLATNAPLWQRAHGGTTAVQLDHSGQALVVGDNAGTVSKIAARTGAVLHSIDHGTAVRAVALHPDGERVACSDADGHAAIWRFTSKTRLASRVVGELGTLAFLDGGTGLVAFQPTDDAGKTVWLLDADHGLAQRALLGHTDLVFAVEVSPDGKTLATGAWDGWVRLWDASGAAIGAFHEDGGVGIIRWSPDGEHIVTGSAVGSISVWNRAGMRLAHVTGHAAFTFSLAVDARGLFLASAGGDHLVKIWELDTLVPLFQFGSGNDYADHLIFRDTDLVSSSPAGTDVWRF